MPATMMLVCLEAEEEEREGMVQLPLPAEWAQGISLTRRHARRNTHTRPHVRVIQRVRQRWLDGIPKRPRKCSSLPRARSLGGAALTKRELEDARILQFLEPNWDKDRPRVRGDCEPGGKNEARPCPWVSCRYNLFLDVKEHADRATIKLNFPHLAGPEEMDPERSCAMDLADDGEHALEEVGQSMNLGVERVRQISASALQELRVKEIREDVLVQIRLDAARAVRTRKGTNRP